MTMQRPQSRSLKDCQSNSLLPTPAKRCLKDRLPKGWSLRNFHPWRTPSDGTRAPSIKKRLRIDTKVRFIAGSLWRGHNLEGAIRSFVVSRLMRTILSATDTRWHQLESRPETCTEPS